MNHLDRCLALVVYYLGIETEEEREMKHKHYEMIVAKAANMDLVILAKTCINGAWFESQNQSNNQWWEDSDYFLCLPQHKEACLHWLNGGQVQRSDGVKDWSSKSDYVDDPIGREYFSGNAFLLHDNKFRIKPKKEKRWIGVREGSVTPRSFLCKDDAMFWVDHNSDASSDYWQFIEIEVEV